MESFAPAVRSTWSARSNSTSVRNAIEGTKLQKTMTFRSFHEISQGCTSGFDCLRASAPKCALFVMDWRPCDPDIFKSDCYLLTNIFSLKKGRLHNLLHEGKKD